MGLLLGARPTGVALGAAVALAVVASACSLALDGYTCSEETCPATTGDEAGGPPAPAADAMSDTSVPPSPDGDGLGDGHDGEKHVVTEESVNAYAALVSDVKPGEMAIDLDRAGSAVPGDLLMIWQTTSDEAVDAAKTPIDLAPLRIGTYELVRATSAAGNVARTTVQLATPLVHAYAAHGAQAIRVAEYTDLVVEAAGTLVAPAWDGSVGGIVAVLVRGGVRVDGALSADAIGGRGGRTFQNPGPFACGTSDGRVPDGYAARGEGLVATAFAPVDPTSLPGGRLNATTGGGGGVCHNAGAGGGGNGSAGGQGGHDYDGNGVGRDVGGLGGVAVTFAAKDRLMLGGGGGAGDRHTDIDTTGGRGGGVVFLRAHDLDVSGKLEADGDTSRVTNHDGAGGGGAGGTIAITVVGAVTCANAIGARGGAGGSTTMSNVGPGGGGGGGHVMITAARNSCAIVVTSGLAGAQANAGSAFGKPYGATPASATAGQVE